MTTPFPHPDIISQCPAVPQPAGQQIPTANQPQRPRGPTPAQQALVGRALRNRRHTLANVLR